VASQPPFVRYRIPGLPKASFSNPSIRSRRSFARAIRDHALRRQEAAAKVDGLLIACERILTATHARGARPSLDLAKLAVCDGELRAKFPIVAGVACKAGEVLAGCLDKGFPGGSGASRLRIFSSNSNRNRFVSWRTWRNRVSALRACCLAIGRLPESDA